MIAHVYMLLYHKMPILDIIIQAKILIFHLLKSSVLFPINETFPKTNIYKSLNLFLWSNYMKNVAPYGINQLLN